MFKLSSKLIEENDKIKKLILDFKYYLKFLENSSEMCKHEVNNIRNLDGTCETYVSMKKEVKNLHETLGKFTKGKENFNLILSSQRSSLNKTGLAFKFDNTHNKEFNRRKMNRHVYKFSTCL